MTQNVQIINMIAKDCVDFLFNEACSNFTFLLFNSIHFSVENEVGYSFLRLQIFYLFKFVFKNFPRLIMFPDSFLRE